MHFYACTQIYTKCERFRLAFHGPANALAHNVGGRQAGLKGTMNTAHRAPSNPISQ